jgi:hypothetical protein
LWYKKLGEFSIKRKSKAKFTVEKKKIPKNSQFFFQENDKIWGRGGTSPHSFAARSEGV